MYPVPPRKRGIDDNEKTWHIKEGNIADLGRIWPIPRDNICQKTTAASISPTANQLKPPKTSVTLTEGTKTISEIKTAAKASSLRESAPDLR